MPRKIRTTPPPVSATKMSPFGALWICRGLAHIDIDLEAGRGLRNSVLRPRAAPAKTSCQIHLRPRQHGWRLRLRKIPRSDLTSQTGTERSSISERLRPGHNVHAVRFGCVKQEGCYYAGARSEGDPAIVACYHFTGLPISSGHTSVRGKVFSSRASSAGVPTRAGNVPKCIGITFLTFSNWQASAASRGPMV
jgi:hypothetical protein